MEEMVIYSIITALILIGEAVKVIICIHKNNESGDSSNSGSFSSNSNSGYKSMKVQKK